MPLNCGLVGVPLWVPSLVPVQPKASSPLLVVVTGALEFRMPVPFWPSTAVKVLPDRVPTMGAAGFGANWLL